MPAPTKTAWPVARREIVLAVLLAVVLLAGFAWREASWYPFLLVAASVLAFLPTLREAVAGVARRTVNIELFNGLAVIASLALGEWFSAAFIALMLTAARMLGAVTSARSRRALEELMALRPTSLAVERAGVIETIAPGELRPDDVVVVREGETVPVDGEVVGGEAVVSEAPVTGESRPVLKVRGAEVLSPSLILSGAVRVRPVRVGADTTLERIIRLVTEAQAAKTPVLRLADRFAAYFLPATVALAVGAYFVTGRAEASIAVLVVVCADDIAVSIPLAFLAAVGVAARAGVIVNGGAALERLGRVTSVFFDKTGTLTFGRPRVESCDLAPGIAEDEFWLAVGSVEKYSKHPFAAALLDEVASRRLVPLDPERFETVPGRGVVALAGGAECLAGNRVFLEERGVAGLPAADGHVEDWHFARAGQFLGRVAITDQPRPEARRALERLRALGVHRVVMLTGDSAEAAAPVVAALGIGEVRARLLPDEKLKVISEARAAGEVTAMVGDGINDAPALAAADVGIAMGRGGTAVAVETAQVVIMRDELLAIPEAIGLARATRRVVVGDFVIWGVTNVVGLALVFTGVFGPAAAAFYNFATDFLPVFNSARLFGWGRRGGNSRIESGQRAEGDRA